MRHNGHHSEVVLMAESGANAVLAAITQEKLKALVLAYDAEEDPLRRDEVHAEIWDRLREMANE